MGIPHPELVALPANGSAFGFPAAREFVKTAGGIALLRVAANLCTLSTNTYQVEWTLST
jgi:hypothetical protein